MSTVLITGASSGFGYLTALHLARRGDRVFATMRNPAGTPELTSTANAENLPLSVHQLDVRDTASVEHAVAEITPLAGTIDVLVNNAGMSIQGPIETLADDELHDQLDTNVAGVVRMVRAVAPLMRAQNAGTIINISSMAGLIGIPFEGAYAASKHAVEAISEALRFELAPFGVQVLLVEPGAYDTAFTGNARQARGLTTDHAYRPAYDHFWQATDTALHADGRGDPADVVDAICSAIDTPDGPFRRLVGADAELVYGLKQQLPFDEFERTIRATLGLDQPDSAAPASAR
ncbi:MAG: SDR family oxidoreductase [Actinomycetota bacterium]|nr:SDR family oxidoreductase [Actinomycetota bacterium]